MVRNKWCATDIGDVRHGIKSTPRISFAHKYHIILSYWPHSITSPSFLQHTQTLEYPINNLSFYSSSHIAVTNIWSTQVKPTLFQVSLQSSFTSAPHHALCSIHSSSPFASSSTYRQSSCNSQSTHFHGSRRAL